MAKEKEKYPGDPVNPPREKVSPKEQMVSIMFRENRKFTLHVGRESKIFRGKESKQIPAKWLKHRDFAQVKHYFVIKGV